MIQLPDSTITAALALVLGLAVGAGGYHLFSASPSPRLLADMEQEGIVKIDRDRALAPGDTADQEEPDVEIRYDTTTVHDTVTLGVPASLSTDPVVSSRTPLDVTSERVEHTFWDPSDSRWETRIYAVPQDRWSASVYALASVSTPLPNARMEMGRVRAGLGAEVSYRRLSVAAELTSGVRLEPVGRVRLTISL